jgi:hypothetical protein
MKNTRAIEVPVNTRKTLPSDSPITAAYIQSSNVAVALLIRWMPKLRTRTKPSGARMTIQMSGVAAIAW